MSRKKKNKGSAVRKIIIPVFWALLSAAVVLALEAGGALRPLELKAYDGFFYLRAKMHLDPERPESPVVMVEIDDRTFSDEQFRTPLTLWHEYFFAVVKNLADGGARAIGLDFLLPRASFRGLEPDYSRTWMKTLFYPKIKGAHLLTGFIEQAGQRITPQARYLRVIGPGHLGVFNLTADGDDFIRRQRLFFPSAEDPKKGPYSIAFLLAKAYRPELKLPADLIHIDYNPAVKPFARFSFAEVYQRALGKKAGYFQKNFKGKIVLIGVADSLTQDRHATPLYYLSPGGQRRTPGVEILGHTVTTILSGRFFSETGGPYRFLIYVLLALVVCYVTTHASQKLFLLVSLALIALYLGAALLAFAEYLILPAVGGTAAILLSLAASFSCRHWFLDKEKREIRGALSRYVSPQVASEVMDNPELMSLGGSRRVMTVFFSDLAGFTSISEKMPPEELVNLLNRYLSLMTEAIMARGGTVDKFEGDAIMAFWGAPLALEDHALRACLAALEQQDLLAGLREELAGQDQLELKARMGLNTGPMIVGNMGSKERFEYTVMGDAVNLASRLEGANKAFETLIMISESTYQEVKDQVEVRDLGLIRVKGKTQTTRVFELLARAGQLPEDKVALRETFEEGLALYQAAEFAPAEEAFGRALAIDPEDGPSKKYLERCQTFKQTRPDNGWAGVYELETK